jgi:hypothetical protein
MPTVLRRSGPDIPQRDGTVKTPRAMIHFCEECGYEGASFGIHVGGVLRSYCGWRPGSPVCIGKGKRVEVAA